ncbi:15145_t:CDS:2, partial [Funneliformis geosporum]
MKASTQASAIPFYNINNQLTVQNPKGIDPKNIIFQLDLRYMKDLSFTYQERKKLFPKGSLHSTNDYFSVIRSIINIPEIHAYLEKNIFVMPMDYPRQKNVCRAIVHQVLGGILSCGHGYHIECFNQANQRCSYCYKYLSDGIKDHCKIFQNTLNMAFDNNVNENNSEDLEDQADLQDSNVDEE